MPRFHAIQTVFPLNYLLVMRVNNLFASVNKLIDSILLHPLKMQPRDFQDSCQLLHHLFVWILFLIQFYNDLIFDSGLQRVYLYQVLNLSLKSFNLAFEVFHLIPVFILRNLFLHGILCLEVFDIENKPLIVLFELFVHVPHFLLLEFHHHALTLLDH